MNGSIRVSFRQPHPPTRSRATTISPTTCSGASAKPAGSDKAGLCRSARRPGPIGQLAGRAEQFSLVLETMPASSRGERVLMCLTDTIDWPTVFLGTL